MVKVGTDLNGQFEQGKITRDVTFWLNLAGLATLLAWTWDLLAERALVKSRWATWLFMLATLALLFWLHPQLEGLMDMERGRLVHRGEFRFRHRAYLHISTAQWLASIVFTILTLMNWRKTDQAPGWRSDSRG